MIMRKDNCSFRQLWLAKQGRCWNIFYLHLHEFHQLLVIPCKACNEVTVNTTVMGYSVFCNVYFLSACRQLEVPASFTIHGR